MSFVVGALFALVAASVQDTVRATLVSRESKPLDLPSYTQLVRGQHPVARQARLARRIAGAELRSARGAIWDPVASVSWDRKTFKGTSYYDYVVAGVKIPTPLGLDFKLGYERTSPSAKFINPDRTTPSSGLLVAGVSIPLARGILTDQRRTAVAQAAAMRDLADADRIGAINKLLFAAVKDYGAWYEAERRRAVTDTGLALAQFRLDAVRQRVQGGDAAAIDTVEARLELARRAVQQLEASAAANAARLEVNQYLWDADGAPIDLPADARPDLGALDAERLDTAQAEAWLARALRQHR